MVLNLNNQLLNWPAGRVKSLFDDPESFRGLQPGFDFCCPAGWGQPHHGTPGHVVSKDPAATATAELQENDRGKRTSAETGQSLRYPVCVLAYRERSASSVGAGDQAALRRGQRDVKLCVVQQQRAGHTHWNRHVANDVLAAGSCHLQGEQVIWDVRSRKMPFEMSQSASLWFQLLLAVSLTHTSRFVCANIKHHHSESTFRYLITKW